MNSITHGTQSDKGAASAIANFSKKFKLYTILKSCNAYKTKGYSVISIFMYLLGVVFTNRSMYMNFITGRHSEQFCKDTVYRFLNSTAINWEKFTTLLACTISSKSITNLTDETRKNVFIIDDTLFERQNSKKVELLSKVYDHSKHSFKRGFRLLTLGWSDGNTFLPVNGCLLASEKEQNLYQRASQDIDKRSVGHQRRVRAQTKATAVMLELLEQAIKSNMKASYVLFDTWFCSPSSLFSVKKLELDVIAMAKKTPKIHYIVDGKKKSLTEIYRSSKKRRGRSRYLISVEAKVSKDDQVLPVKIVYVRNRNKRNDYLALISTDMTISEDEIVRVYGKRWDIEVFFKVCKSYLKLAKGCRSLSYDAASAHVAIVFARYMMLSTEQRMHLDQRSLGEIFFYICDELTDITLHESLYLLMQALLTNISDKISLTEKQLEELIHTFIETLPEKIRGSLILCT